MRGFVGIDMLKRLDDMRTHYARVGEELRKNYVENMTSGLDHWVQGADEGCLAWGITHFKKTGHVSVDAGIL